MLALAVPLLSERARTGEMRTNARALLRAVHSFATLGSLWPPRCRAAL